jgi:protein-tyrosine-phosphatase
LDGYFDPAEFLSRVGASPAERVLAGRLWPGPVGWIDDEFEYPTWVPSHHAVASVLSAYPGSLALFELNDGKPVDLEILAAASEIVLDDGQVRDGPITLLRPIDSRWEIVRPGVLGETAIRESLARRIVFVCTGNTCRSPLAAGLFQFHLARRLDCPIDEVLAKGYLVSSAGISAIHGDPASGDSIDAARELGVDLSGHRSQQAMVDLIARADDVIAMTRSHLLTLVSKFPVLNGSLRLLCGPEGDLDDPIGRGPEVYRACAATVQRHVDRLITEMALT